MVGRRTMEAYQLPSTVGAFMFRMSNMVRILPVIFLLLALSLGTGCDSSASRPSDPPTSGAAESITNYLGRGIVRSLGADGKSVVIKHEAISNFMDAMTMPFPVREPSVLKGLTPGDSVTFRLRVTATDGWIDTVERTSAAPTPSVSTSQLTNSESSSASPEIRQVPVVPVISPGEIVPNYTFTNQLGAAFDLASLRGQVVVLDFIFTRCPFPDFCPRLSRNLAALQKRLKETPPLTTNCHLVSLSFDPRFDTPDRLTNYGKAYGADAALWSLSVASMDTVERLAGHFELYFARDVEPAQQNHNLRTVVIDRQGRLVKVFKGNQWTVDELVESVVGSDRR